MPEVKIKIKNQRSKTFSQINKNISELGQNGCDSISFGKVDFFLGKNRN